MKDRRKVALVLIVLSAILLIFGGLEIWKNASPEKNLKMKNTEGAVQIIMNDLCREEVQQYCPDTWGMATYGCIKAIDPKFLSAKCLSTFK
jgi:hypothetical protein